MKTRTRSYLLALMEKGKKQTVPTVLYQWKSFQKKDEEEVLATSLYLVCGREHSLF